LNYITHKKSSFFILDGANGEKNSNLCILQTTVDVFCGTYGQIAQPAELNVYRTTVTFTIFPL